MLNEQESNILDASWHFHATRVRQISPFRSHPVLRRLWQQGFIHTVGAPEALYPIHEVLVRRWQVTPTMLVHKNIEEVSHDFPDWDGYDALPILPETKLNALIAADVLGSAAPLPTVTPNPNGTLSFEWETKYGIAELEIGRTRYSFYIRPSLEGAPILRDGEATNVDPLLGQYVKDVLYPPEGEILSQYDFALAINDR